MNAFVMAAPSSLVLLLGLFVSVLHRYRRHRESTSRFYVLPVSTR